MAVKAPINSIGKGFTRLLLQDKDVYRKALLSITMGGFVIQHNISAMNSNRTLNITTGNLAKSSEKLSSGYKVNRAADDAAGLAISEKMRRQIRGLSQASRNCQDGVSLIQIAEGSLHEVHDMLQRSNELAVKASNDTMTDTDRMYVEAEYRQILDQIDKNAACTTFNEIHLFPSEGYSPTDSFSVEQNINFNMTLGADGNVSASDITISYPSTLDGVTTPGENWDTLGQVISETLIPNAVNQIFNAFPSIKTAFESQSGGSEVPISLDIKYVDGASNTLAYASLLSSTSNDGTSYTVHGLTLGMTVDKDDFSNSSVSGTEGTNTLESTIAHELTHTLMQYTMPIAMTKGFLPTWFTEGVAQLTGGGVATNWNNGLYNAVSGLTSENDSSKDEAVANYLKSYTMANRPYGHGYLMSAYLGYLASGSSAVNASSIATGMNKIMQGLIDGKDLGTTLKDLGIVSDANTYQSTLASWFSGATADSDITEFMRKLAYNTNASNGGQGSIIGDGGLSGSNIVDNASVTSPLVVSSAGAAPVNQNYPQGAGTGGALTPGASSGGTEVTGANTLFIQAGSENEASNRIGIKLFNMDSTALGLNTSNMMTADAARSSIDSIKAALAAVSNVRSYYGATQNRLEHTIKNLDNVVENTSDAESQIRDTDMAEEMVRYSNMNILAQAGQSMLAQANQSKQGVLSLLQ